MVTGGLKKGLFLVRRGGREGPRTGGGVYRGGIKQEKNGRIPFKVWGVRAMRRIKKNWGRAEGSKQKSPPGLLGTLPLGP